MRSRTQPNASTHPGGSRIEKVRRLVTAALVGVLSLSMVVTAAGVNSQPAAAAAYGPSYDFGNGHIGAYRVGSTNVYCLRPEEARPTGTTSFAGYQTWPGGASGPTMSATANARVSWAIATYGQSSDANWTSAVAMYVWSLADPTEYNSHGMSGDSWYIGRVPSAQRNTVRANLATIRANDDGIVAGSTGAGTGSLVFSVDEGNNYLGTMTVGSLNPSTATGTITLTNGIFLATGTNVVAGATAGMTFDVQGVPPTDDGEPYKISGVGNFTAGGGWRGEVAVYTTPGAQPLAGPGRPAVNNFQITGLDPADRATVFQPALTTQVASKFIEPGQPFDDVVTFTTVPDADGLNNPWYQRLSGNYEQIVAQGTVYGPFLQQPVEADEVPIGAPIAGTATLTTSLVDGPTVPYTVTTTEVAVEPGFYTWVWEINYDDQPVRTQLYLPDAYSFVDRFGQVAETQISPTQLRFTTELTTDQAAVSDQVDDVIDVYTVGGWLRDGGARVPVVLTGTAYYSATRPEVADTPPATAEVIGTYTATTDTPGAITAENIDVGLREGFVTLVWCVDPAAQPTPLRGLTAAWCDQYGLASETVEVSAPIVVTAAQPLATPSGTVTDTAIVSGLVPASGMEITFEGFLQPQDATAPVCEASNRIYASSAPITVTEPGEYTSEEFAVTMDHLGTVYWVETARLPDGTVIHVGECGLPNETTLVQLVEVTTQATEKVELGEQARDTALLVGTVPPGAVITFNAYRQPDGTPTAGGGQLDDDGIIITPVCEAENRVFDGTEEPVTAPVGNFPDGTTVDGPVTRFTEPGTYFWVETLRDRDGQVLHQGECGAPDETTFVSTPTPPLPVTGASELLVPLGLLAGGLSLAGLTAIMITTIRRRHQVKDEVASAS
jgi:hypothetical protein